MTKEANLSLHEIHAACPQIFTEKTNIYPDNVMAVKCLSTVSSKKVNGKILRIHFPHYAVWGSIVGL